MKKNKKLKKERSIQLIKKLQKQNEKLDQVKSKSKSKPKQKPIPKQNQNQNKKRKVMMSIIKNV